MRNNFKEKSGLKGNGCQADKPLKSFELFFDDAVITEIVTWTNQEIENVKNQLHDLTWISCTIQARQKFAHS